MANLGLKINGKLYDWRVLLTLEAERFVANNPEWKILDKKIYKEKYTQTGVKKSSKTILIKL